jgi:hypothetical protein
MLDDILNQIETESKNLKELTIGKPSTVGSFAFGPKVSSTVPKVSTENIRAKDTDTFVKDGVTYRDYGIDQPEVSNYDPNTGTIKFGKDQGSAVIANQALNDYGYNKGTVVGKDVNQRSLLKREDKYGNKADEFLTRNYLAPVSKQTSPEAFEQRTTAYSASRVFPDLLDRNPLLAEGLKANQESINKAKAMGFKQPVAPMVVANDPEELAYLKNTYSPKAIRKLGEDIDDLKSTLAMDQRALAGEGGFTDKVLTDDQRKYTQSQLLKTQIKLQQARNLENFYQTSFINFKKDDRTIDNQAHDNFYMDSLHVGALNLAQWTAGKAQLVGDAYAKATDDEKINWLSKGGREAWRNIGQNIAAMPQVGGEDLLDTFQGNKSFWGKFTAASDTIASSLVSSIPSMLATASGGWLAGLAKGIGGIGAADAALLGLAPIAGIFAGKNYGSQPEDKKDISLALGTGLAEAVAEKLQIAGLTGTNKLGSLFSGKTRNQLADALVDSGRVTTRQEGLELIKQVSKKELVELADYSNEFVKKQYLSKESMLRGTAYLAENGLLQASQEMIQQYSEAVGSRGANPLDVRYEAGFNRSILNAGLGGLGFAAAFAGPRMIADTAQWHSIDSSMQDYQRNLTEAQQYQAENQEKLNKNNGGFTSIENGVDQIRDSLFEAKDQYATTDLYALPATRGVVENLKGIVMSPIKSLFAGLSDRIVPSVIDNNGNVKEYSGLLKAMMTGGGLINGAHFARYVQSLAGQTAAVSPDLLASQLKISKEEASNLIKFAANGWWKNGELLPTDTDDYKANSENEYLNKWYTSQLEAINDLKAHGQANGITSKLFTDPNFMFDSHLIDPSLWNKNKALIISELLANNPSISSIELRKAVNNITSGNKQLVENAKNFLSQYDTFNNPKLNFLFEPNIFENIDSLKTHLVKEIGISKYYGKNGEILAKVLSKAYNNGEFGPKGDSKTEKAFREAVGNTQAYFEIIKGNYHSLEDHPNLAKAVGWLNTLAMMASLGKATLSSMVEIPYTMLGTPHNLFQKQLNAVFNEMKSELGDDINRASSFAMSNLFTSWAMSTTDYKLQAKLKEIADKRGLYDDEYKNLDMQGSNDPKVLERKIELRDKMDALDKDTEIMALKEREFVRSLLQNLGYKHEMANFQSKFEIVDSRQRNAMSFFASLIGLRAQTDAMRIAVLTVAGDILTNYVMQLAEVDPNIREIAFATGNGLTKGQANALVELQQYGMDVYSLMKAIDQGGSQNFFTNEFAEKDPNKMSDEMRKVYDNVQTVLGNFVDARVVNPQPHNIPKYYHNPYLRVFTIMTRFMAAAHSTILPRLYKQYMLSGNAGMTYSSFVTVAGALLMAGVGNILKDQLSYGEESPYVKGKAKRAQRNLHSSGLLGQFERVSDFISPVYPQSKVKITEEPGKWAYEKAKDISPTFNYAARVGEGAKEIVEGKVPQGTAKLIRALPVVGSFPIVSLNAKELLKDMKGN